MIIDCHIHPSVDADSHAGWFLPYDGAAAQFAYLRSLGIARACGSPIKRMDPADFAEVRALNDQAIALRDDFPELYIPGVHIHPRFPRESIVELERCHALGVRWVGELVGYFMGYAEDFATPEMFEIMRAAAGLGMVANIHCGVDETVDKLCRAVPELKLVLAHPGNRQAALRERVAMVAAHPNLHLDLSGTGIDRLGVVRFAIDTAGVDKILFGSDYTINNPGAYVGAVKAEPLTDDEFNAVMSGNFLRLMGLKNAADEVV